MIKKLIMTKRKKITYKIIYLLIIKDIYNSINGYKYLYKKIITYINILHII